MMKCRLTSCAFHVVLAILICTLHVVYGKEKVRLTDISALTFYAGRHTTGRRSSPVPQLQCVGGTAGCGQFQPQVVQCYNKGNDGVDVQWECKADLDDRVKLGAIEVVCEGYDYANDPYVLRGSCGLEYQLNWKSPGSGGGYTASDSSWRPTKGRGFVFSDLLLLAIVLIIMYALYKTCLTTPQHSPTDPGYPDGRPGSYGSFPSAPPPPYSSRPSSDEYYGADCHGSSSSRRSGGGQGSGSFWTGAATGGILGYLFGQNRNQGYTGSSRHHGYTAEGNSNWGFGRGGNSRSSGGSYSRTSTSTSFGGTRRR